MDRGNRLTLEEDAVCSHSSRRRFTAYLVAVRRLCRVFVVTLVVGDAFLGVDAALRVTVWMATVSASSEYVCLAVAVDETASLLFPRLLLVAVYVRTLASS